MSDAPPDPTPPSRIDREMAKLWTGVFLANLPIPVLMAYGTTSGSGVAGLIAALAVLYWVGFILCAGRFCVGRSLVQGGIVVAVSQFFPVLQALSGMFALVVWKSATGYPLWVFHDPNCSNDQPALYALGVFVVVLLTAQPLWIIAILTGAFFRWHLRDTPIWFHSSAEPSENPAL
ncbi:MAG: hypothetical protein ABGY75_09140 [Gemmataceae bacterium]